MRYRFGRPVQPVTPRVTCPLCGRVVGAVYPSKTLPAAHKNLETGEPCKRLKIPSRDEPDA